MCLNRSIVRVVLPLSVAALAALALNSCSDRKPVPAPTSSPAPASPPANTAPTPTSNAPVVTPGTGTDVATKKGTETGMVGGESGTVASSGKPGSGTSSGAGTGAAEGSGDKTVNKK
ncbi:MAG TPA: hypothetical protein VES91_10215 [Burkholderiaceae bacterium]|nr:hypothetical protein [Burkholderiaceae bacterium]